MNYVIFFTKQNEPLENDKKQNICILTQICHIECDVYAFPRAN